MDHYICDCCGQWSDAEDRVEALEHEVTALRRSIAQLLEAGECETVDELINELETSF